MQRDVLLKASFAQVSSVASLLYWCKASWFNIGLPFFHNQHNSQKDSHCAQLPSSFLAFFCDNAYVNTSFMATPFKGSNSGVKDAYNFYHSQLRINIECAFGMLVHRWGVLRKPLPVNIYCFQGQPDRKGLVYSSQLLYWRKRVVSRWSIWIWYYVLYRRWRLLISGFTWSCPTTFEWPGSPCRWPWFQKDKADGKKCNRPSKRQIDTCNRPSKRQIDTTSASYGDS